METPALQSVSGNKIVGTQTGKSAGSTQLVAAVAQQPVVTAAPTPALAPLALTPAQALVELDPSSDTGVPGALVLLVTPNRVGSAIIVDASGHLLTAWHLVAGFSRVTVWLKAPGQVLPDSQQPRTARVVRANRNSDLALLVLDGTSLISSR